MHNQDISNWFWFITFIVGFADFAFGVVKDGDDNGDDKLDDCKFVAATATTACLSSFLYKNKLIIKEHDWLTICYTKLT